MLKIYLTEALHSGTPDYWDNNWEEHGSMTVLSDVNRACESNPICRLLNEKVKKDRLFMDGGCGPSQWVKYFHDRGFSAFGVDFARATIEKVRKIAPGLNIQLGDITDLELKDGSVHVYYSGGVFEHFEEGPMKPLKEARRVLSSDGWFLCSIPDLTWLREKVLYRTAGDDVVLKKDTRFAFKKIDKPELDRDSVDGISFHQYLYSESEFRRYLEAAGFRVVDSFCYNLVWGLQEIPSVRRFFDFVSSRRAPAQIAATSPASSAPIQVSGKSSLKARAKHFAKDAFILERRDLPMVGPVVSSIVERMGNLRMYVAQPA